VDTDRYISSCCTGSRSSSTTRTVGAVVSTLHRTRQRRAGNAIWSLVEGPASRPPSRFLRDSYAEVWETCAVPPDLRRATDLVVDTGRWKTESERYIGVGGRIRVRRPLTAANASGGGFDMAESQHTPITRAAIYARKSTEQQSADADAKSVTRQIADARTFAATKGWLVSDAHVYADDATSGAETAKLVNRQ
jgi:hypothetical protein